MGGHPHMAFKLTFPRRGKVARVARRMGDVEDGLLRSSSTSPIRLRHLPPPGEGRIKKPVMWDNQA